MINRSQFEQEIVKYSRIPYVATARGYWIDSLNTSTLLSKMSTTYLNSCLNDVKSKINVEAEFNYLKKFIQEPVNEYNSNEFIDYLDKLIMKKRKEIELELEKR